MKKYIIVIVVLAVVGGGWYVLTHNSGSSNSQNTNTAVPSSTDNAVSTITYTGSGFNPGILTVKSGDKVTINNDSSSEVQFQSNPHPAHTDNPELNIGLIEPGKSATFTATTKGTWGYHNHLSIGDTGTIVVE